MDFKVRNTKIKYLNKLKKRNVWGFILAGSITTILDIIFTSALVYMSMFGPLLSRILSLSICIVINWLLNRTITFQMQTSPNIKEFIKFVSTASTSMIMNYLIYTAIIISIPYTINYPALAIIPATAISLIISYLLMKFFVFSKKNY